MVRLPVDIDEEKVEQTVLALLHLTSFGDKFGLRAWKQHGLGGYEFAARKGLHFQSSDKS
jgi:hypothetical protein